MRFFSHPVAAKGLLLTCITATSALVLLSPDSLTSKASDQAGLLADVLAATALLMTVIGWADIVWTDLLGRVILPSIPTPIRHKLCVTLYAAMTGWYAVFAFATTDPDVHTSWILVLDYLAIATFGAVLTVAIAREPRKEDR